MKYCECWMRHPPVLEALLETRHGPALNRPWEGESALKVPEVVRATPPAIV